MTHDTRLSDEVLKALGFVRHAPDSGHPNRYTLIRHGVRVDVDHPTPAHGGGFDVDGMRPVDVGDLLVTLVTLGQKHGRRECLYNMLENVEVGHVFDWVKAVRGLQFVDKEPAAVKKPAARKKPTAKTATKKPLPKKAAKRRGSRANTM